MQGSCKDDTEFPLLTLQPASPQVNFLQKPGAFIKMKKLPLVPDYSLNTRLFGFHPFFHSGSFSVSGSSPKSHIAFTCLSSSVSSDLCELSNLFFPFQSGLCVGMCMRVCVCVGSFTPFGNELSVPQLLPVKWSSSSRGEACATGSFALLDWVCVPVHVIVFPWSPKCSFLGTL